MIQRILFSMLVIVFLFSCKDEEKISEGCLSAGLQNGLIAFYPFNNGDLADQSGGQHDLINTTGAIPAADRNNNGTCAFQLDNTTGADQFLANMNPVFLNNLPAFSISLWYVHTDPNATGAKYQILLSRGDAPRCPDRRGEWSVGLYDCTRPVFGHDNSVWADLTSGEPLACQNEINILLNAWHHVVAVKNGNAYSIYVDGVLDETVTGIADCGSSNYTAQDIGDLLLGKYFTGRIDDVLIHNRALPASEVSELFALEGCCE